MNGFPTQHHHGTLCISPHRIVECANNHSAAAETETHLTVIPCNSTSADSIQRMAHKQHCTNANNITHGHTHCAQTRLNTSKGTETALAHSHWTYTSHQLHCNATQLTQDMRGLGRKKRCTNANSLTSRVHSLRVDTCATLDT
jgi:hypothetical protein